MSTPPVPQDFAVFLNLNASPASASWLIPPAGPLSGDRFFSVTALNSFVSFGLIGGTTPVTINDGISSGVPFPCLLILTQLQ